jgi:hypothetical protein
MQEGRPTMPEVSMSEVVDGVSVWTGLKGGKIAPAIRRYPQPLKVETVGSLYRKQRERDAKREPDVVNGYRTGHFGGIVDPTTFRCDKDNCPCQQEDLPSLRVRSLGK